MQSVDPVEARLNRFGGWALMFMGMVHLLLAGAGIGPGFFRDIVSAGFFNTVSVVPPPELMQRNAVFWATFGSFAPVTFLLGYFVVWAAKRNQEIPGLLGPFVLLLGLLDSAIATKGGFYIFVIAGGLLIAATQRRRAAHSENAG